MILPQSYISALILMLFSALCLGSWISAYKLTGKWRFELFYWDYVFGALAATTLAALTFGSLGFDGFLFMDDLMRAGKRNIAYGMAAGVIFNLGNMLLTGAVSVSSMTIAFPISLGIGMIGTALWNYTADPARSLLFIVAGSVLILAAATLAALTYRRIELARSKLVIKSGRGKTVIPRAGWKAVILSGVSGALMGSFAPFIERGMRGDAGVGPYSLAFSFSVGMFLSTFVLNLFFMNLPVQGQPVEIPDYLRGSLKNHALGVTGGFVWGVGAVISLVVGYGPEARLGPLHFGLAQGAALVAPLIGLFVWKELKGQDAPVRLMTMVMLALLAGGIALVTIAPLFPR